MKGLILAAPSSGAGKTTITLGVLRALKNAQFDIRSAKSGPDYIDPQFHAAATGKPCLNLDAWAMSPDLLRQRAAGSAPLIIEGAMGLFDGAPPKGKGSSAQLSRILGVPVVLIIDAKAMSHSVAALVSGFARFDPDVRVAGIILNRVGSPRHGAMLKSALLPLGIPVLGAVPRSDALSRPSRHLGLVQAGEMPDLDTFLNTAADMVAQHIDMNALMYLASGLISGPPRPDVPKNTSKRIAIAQDAAFSFVYPHMIEDWRANGATLIPFSPLADEPVPEADEVFLPGGYPELYAARLSNATTFMQSLRDSAQTSDIYGECGGYMTLGETLIDGDGTPHKMAGLLGLTTSFAKRKLHLGYRDLKGVSAAKPGTYKAHEFHYATTLDAQGSALFQAADAEGNDLGEIGLSEGRVSGSFAHIIDTA